MTVMTKFIDPAIQRVRLVDQPGLPITVTSYKGDQSLAIEMSPLRALKLAAELLEAAQSRMSLEDFDNHSTR